MNENNELMLYVYKSSEMGKYSVENVLDNLKNKENNIKTLLESELKKYEHYFSVSKSILERNDVDLPNENILAKIGNDIGVMFETMKDNSDSAIAKMMIEGLTMGVVEMESKISKYSDVCDREYLKIAREFLEFQQGEIDKLKTFM